MDIERFKGRMRLGDIRELCLECCGSGNEDSKEELFSLACNEDDRIAYNTLWVFTHFPATDMRWLSSKRDVLIDLLLHTDHVGKQRLILTLLEHQSIPVEEIRTDYLDFCLSKINATAPYAIRALSLKQAYRMCRHYPDLLTELRLEMDMMIHGPLSPGLRSAIRSVRRKLAKQ